MNTNTCAVDMLRRPLLTIGLAAGMIGLATPASAYSLYKTSSCTPGLRWDTSRPVTVRLLAESVTDYLQKQGRGLSGMTGFVRDVQAVIDLYNSVPGSRLVLQFGTGINGDRRLDAPEIDDFGDQTIVIGFTDGKLEGKSAEAWVSDDPDDGCTRTRAHVIFRDAFDWIYGPSDTTDVDGRSFYTASQPRIPGSTAPARTFLGILTHEMGHAVGLGHPDNNYAVMAQSFRTWFRGKDHVLHTRLLPDDTAGLLVLYATPGARKPLDISVSNTWYKSAQAQYGECAAEQARVNAAERALRKALGLFEDAAIPAGIYFKTGQHTALVEELFAAQEALRECQDSQHAKQIRYCKVSSEGDNWTDRLASPLPFCGVNLKGSSFAPVSDRVCPGERVQLRYTLNNHTSLRDALVKTEVWFSPDTQLDIRNGSDARSPDVREFTVQAADSATVGQKFRLPANMRDGERLYVFVRAIPHDPSSGESLWNCDVAPWNNAIMLASQVRVDSSVCR